MEIEQYRNKLKHPSLPTKPMLSNKATAEDYRKHADKLEQYDRDLTKYKAEKDAYGDEEAKQLALFKQDLFEELEIADNPLRNKLYSLAWERGHSGGLNEIYYEASVLAQLIELVPSREQLRRMAIYFKAMGGHEKDNAWTSVHNEEFDAYLRNNLTNY